METNTESKDDRKKAQEMKEHEEKRKKMDSLAGQKAEGSSSVLKLR